MKILVIGGAGFIGSNLIKHLIVENDSYEITSLDCYWTGLKSNHISHRNVKYIEGYSWNIAEIFNVQSFDLIYHFGEFSRVVESFNQLNFLSKSNLYGTSMVLHYAKENNTKIIYSASSSAFANDGKDENLSPYSWSKSKNIELIKNYSKWFGLKYELVYFYNVYGEGQIKNSEMAAVIGIFEELYKKGKPLTVVAPGTQKRNFTHISDIINGCFLAWKKGKQNEYMIGSNKTYTIIQIAKMFESKIKYLPVRRGERFGSTKKNNNAKKILGYSPKIKISNYIKNFKKKYSKSF